MSDTAPMPGSGPGFPTYSGADVAQPAAQTQEAAIRAAKQFDNSPEWRRVRDDENAPGRLALMEQRRALYDAAYPEPPPNAPPPLSPPVSSGELDVSLSNNLRFPLDTTDDDRAAFRTAARDGLAAIGASAGEVGHFTLAASAVLRAPDSFTPETAERALRATWGAEYEANLSAAKEAAKRLPSHVRAHLTETPIGNHPRIMQLLADAGRRMRGQR